MATFTSILNSPFGLLVAGALISGLLVQYITSRWQQRSWVFQQNFTAHKAQFERRLERQYKILDDLNADVAAVLANTQFVVAAHVKRVHGAQSDQVVTAYNDQVLKWELAFPLHKIHLESQFSDAKLVPLWSELKQKRDELDLAVSELMAKPGNSPDKCVDLVEKITNAISTLSKRMLSEMNARQTLGSG